MIATCTQAVGLALLLGTGFGFWCGVGFQEFHHRQERRRRQMIDRAQKEQPRWETR